VGLIYGDTILRFDPTVSWGTLISIVSFVITIAIAYTRIMTRFEARMSRMEMKLNIMWATWRRDHDARPADDQEFFNGTK